MKKMTRIFGVLLLVASAVILTSCKDDEPAIPESVVNWTLTLPETASDGTVSDVTALFTNINTSKFRHFNVQKNQIIMPFLECFLKFLTGVEYLNLQPAPLFPSPDIVLQLAAHLKVIITYCYLYHAPVPVPQF